MASQGEIGLSDSISYAVLHGLNHPFINQQGSTFDFGELEEDFVLQGLKIHSDEAKLPLYTAKPAPTLEMFPSWPMRFHQTPRESSRSRGESSGSGSGSRSRSAVNTVSSRGEGQLESESPISSRKASSDQQQVDYFDKIKKHLQPPPPPSQQQIEMATDSLRTGSLQIQSATKTTSEKRKGHGSTSERAPDAKTLRRLAQNREAARKSRIRKKAYVQQLESSRIRLSQLEQDLQRARSQGLFFGGGGGNISSGAAIFDMEYARWLDDDHKHMVELRTGLNAHLSDGDLQLILDGCIAHYDEIFFLKGAAAKSDVFHLINGMWITPAERCFLWMGGFRPSELIKMLIPQLDPLTQQQLMGVYSLQHSSQQAEEALSQGLDQLQQSLIDTISGGSVPNGVHHMAAALAKITNLEGFVCQADNLRQQTLHQLRRLLTVRQAAKCFLVIGEYYGRLRALSSIWASRPRETLMNEENSCQTTMDLQIVHSSQNNFSIF